MDMNVAPPRLAELVAILTAGGDSRLTLDAYTGRNKYHCPLLPAPDLICFASCTASPMSPEGLLAAESAWHRLTQGATVQAEAAALARHLRALLGLEGLAEVLLAPSGTDATLLLMGLLVAERPAMPITSILAAAAETGSGVPLAAAGCHFSELAAGSSHVTPGEAIGGFPAGTQSRMIALRTPEGCLRPAAAVDADFAAAVAAAPGRPVVHVIDGSKTGLVAPATVPAGVDVVVDACQARLPIERLHQYLERGWPVLITGSKYYGGPAFSGAVLFPAGRLARIDRAALPAGMSAYGINPAAAQPAANAGTVVRWAAALEEMARICPSKTTMRGRMERICRAVVAGLERVPGLLPVQGPVPPTLGPHGIFAFALRDPADPAALLGMSELRVRHRRLAESGLLLGQPIEIGARHGALRIAIGAHNLHDPATEAKLAHCMGALQRMTTA